MADNFSKLVKHRYNTNVNNVNQNNSNKQIISSLSNKNMLISTSPDKNININIKNSINNNNINIINHSNSLTNLKNQNLSFQSNNVNINNSLKDKLLKSKSISKFYLKNNSTMNKSKSKPKQIQIPKCKQKNKKSIILNIKIGKKNNENSISIKKNNDSYSIDKTPLNTNQKIMSKINNYYSHTQSNSNINKTQNGHTQSCININKEFLFDKLNEKHITNNNDNNDVNDLNSLLNNKYLENTNIQSIKNLKIDTELNKYLSDINKDYQTYNGSFNESPLNIQVFNNKKNNIYNSDINYLYSNSIIYNTNDSDLLKQFNNITNLKNKKSIIPNNFIKNKYLLSTYDKVASVFNNINSSRNSINVNVFQNIKNINKSKLKKINHLKYNSSQNINNNYNSTFNQTWKLAKINNSSLNLIKNKKKRKNKSVEIIDKINFNIKNINISNNFIKIIENSKLIKPTYQIKLDIIKRRTINMLEFYINLAKNAVDQNIYNQH